MIAAPTRTAAEVLDAVLSRLECVRPRGAARYSARCPAHADRSPSLSISEGYRAVLLKCWAGCPTPAIVQALGLSMSDLFYDRPRSAHSRALLPPPPRPFDWRRTASDQSHKADALRLRSSRTLVAATGVNLSQLTDQDTDAMLNAVADAYADRDLADQLEQSAFKIREDGIHEERERYALRRASHS